MKIVIVAGGKGTRIASIANEVPKPMIPIAGKPVVEYQVELAKRYGYKDFIFILGYLGEKIRDYFGDGTKWDVNITYYQEDVPLGTSGALRYLKDQLHDDFWFFYGDTILDINMNLMLEYHRRNDAIGTLFLHPNDHPDDSDLVEINSEGRIIKFHPKPHPEGEDFHNLVNAALYILKPQLINFIPLGDKSDFGKDIFPKILEKGGKLAGYNSPEYIKDMGTPDRWEKVSSDILSGKVANLNLRNKRPAVFLDRDGVICEEVNLLTNPNQVKLIDGVSEAVRLINKSGYLAVLVTNQPVIARNLCSLKELDDIHKRLEMLLGKNSAYLDRIYFCPHHPDKGYPEERKEYKINCECRKPKPGMILKAAKEMNIDLENSIMIGDRDWDVQAGVNAGLGKSIKIIENEQNALFNVISKLL